VFAVAREALSREVLATAAIGLILIGLGTPRLVAAVTAAPAAASGDPARRVDRDAAALRWRRSGGLLKQLGLAQGDLADHAASGAGGADDLRRAARQNLEAGLALAPADPAAWAALARLDFGQNDPDRAPRALALSLLTGPNEPDLLWPRLELALAKWSSLADSDRALMAAQLRQAWGRDPAKLVDLARRNAAGDAVRSALADQPDAVTQFNSLLGGG
jgi:hypothetical protein